MGYHVYPCIIYQRLRPSAPEASRWAQEVIWPRTHELVARAEYTPCGLYGDSEFAPPFCGGSEIRPGFELAVKRAKVIATRLGICTLIIGDGSAIGDGDPFLPTYQPLEGDGLQVCLVNSHLQSEAHPIALQSAWRYFENSKGSEVRAAQAEPAVGLAASTHEIELLVRRDPERLLARFYLANPLDSHVTFQWKQLVRHQDHAHASAECPEWVNVEVLAGHAAYLGTVFQGDMPWVRQVRVRHQAWGRKVVGSAHISPSDMSRERIGFTWEEQA